MPFRPRSHYTARTYAKAESFDACLRCLESRFVTSYKTILFPGICSLSQREYFFSFSIISGTKHISLGSFPRLLRLQHRGLRQTLFVVSTVVSTCFCCVASAIWLRGTTPDLASGCSRLRVFLNFISFSVPCLFVAFYNTIDFQWRQINFHFHTYPSLNTQFSHSSPLLLYLHRLLSVAFKYVS